MAAPNEKLAESLDVLKALQGEGRRVFQLGDLSRIHRERLLANGYLQEVMKGWLISSGPGARSGDSTPWYVSFWEFCARYCGERFGGEWFLSAEQSLGFYCARTAIPQQIVVCSPKGTNHAIEFLCGASLFDLKVTKLPAPGDIVVRDGLRLFSPAAALVSAAESFLARNAVEAQVVLASLGDASDLMRLLLNSGHSAKAGAWQEHFGRWGGLHWQTRSLARRRVPATMYGRVIPSRMRRYSPHRTAQRLPSRDA
jgi:hypothetical protein